MNRTKTLIRYADGGHSWLKVKRSELERLGIEHLISTCSYQRKDYVYLEEDCDAGLYLKAAMGHKDKNAIVTWRQIAQHFNIKTRYSQHSRIRQYEYYNARENKND